MSWSENRTPTQDVNMLKHIDVNLDLLAEEGKAYKWQSPPPCNCGHKFWGHGFVERYFDDFDEKFWLKRYRCPNCKAIITLFPNGYLKYFRYSLLIIYQSLSFRLTSYIWPPALSRQRGGHWLNRLKRFCVAKFGVNSEGYNLRQRLAELFNNMTDFLSS